jgi:hypothetical protein
MHILAVLLITMSASVLSCDVAMKNPFPMPECHGFRLEEASIDTIQQTLHSGRLTSRQLIQCYVERVNEVNIYMRQVQTCAKNAKFSVDCSSSKEPAY